MIAVSDVAFGMTFLIALIVACIVYVVWFGRDVPAPTFTEREHVRLVERPTVYDWSADSDLNDDLCARRTVVTGRASPNWVRAETG